MVFRLTGDDTRIYLTKDTWTTIAGKTVTDSAMRRLLAGRKVGLKGFTSRKGGKFDAALRIDEDKGIAFDFGDGKERKKK